jgi:hypothetical protein
LTDAGLELSFWSAVFITSVGHTSSFSSSAKRLTGLCGMAVGVGEIVGKLNTYCFYYLRVCSFIPGFPSMWKIMDYSNVIFRV